MKIRKALVLVSVVAFASALSLPAANAASKGKTSTSKTTTSKSSSKTSTSKSSSKTTTSKSTSKTRYSNFGYTPKSLPTNMDIPPVFNFETGTSINSGVAFSLVDEAPASRVLSIIQGELAESDLACETIPDPYFDAHIPLLGTIAKDTIAACQHGDPHGKGFIEYVLTSNEAVKLYNTKENEQLYLTFRSPIPTILEQIQFTPSSRAILFVIGGEYAFDASEISWATLYNARFSPPKR